MRKGEDATKETLSAKSGEDTTAAAEEDICSLMEVRMMQRMMGHCGRSYRR